MPGDRELQGLDPYDLMDAEAGRIDRFVSGLDDAGWARPSRCEGWSVRDVIAHLASGEDYNAACLAGTVSDLLAEFGARGATDLGAANEMSIRDRDALTNAEALAEWRRAGAENRRRFRERDGGDVDTSVGGYPARWQAFHLAFELATHADDIGVPLDPGDADARMRWEPRFARFALAELKPDLEIAAGEGTTRVRGEGVDVELSDADFVQAVAARLPADSELDDKTRSVLSVTP